MIRVEVQIPSAHEISSVMGASRAWLAHQRIDAFLYCSCEPDGLACFAKFRRSADAAVFAAAFGGSVTNRQS